jgi:capsular exopolysaccharide synthesis family protein
MIAPNENFDPHQAPATEFSSSELVHALVRLLHIAQYRRKTILRCLCAAVIAGALYFALATRYYESTAKLLIVRRDADQVASVADQPSMESTLATHREIVISPVVVQSAIEHLLPEHRVDLANTPESEWRRIVSDNLSAKTSRKANFIEVSYRSRSPDAAAAVVSAVVQSYLEFVERTHKGYATEAIGALTQKSDELAATLTAKKNELQACRDRVGSLAIRTNDGTMDPAIQRALKLNDALMEAQQKRIKIEGSLAAIKTAVQNNEDLQQYLASLEQVVGQQLLISALGVSPQDITLIKNQEQKLLDTQAELQRISAFYGPGHPNITALNERIQQIEQYLLTYRSRNSNQLSNFGGKELGPLVQKMLEQSLARAVEQERQLQLAFDAEKKNARAQSDDLQRLQDVDREVTRLETEYDELIGKITMVDTRQLQAPIQATVVEEPLPDEHAATPRLRLVAMLSLVGGLFVGGFIAYAQDALDDRFSSPEEMFTQLGAPVLGIVRKLEAINGSGLATVHTFASPSAAHTESFRTLRTALTLSAGATDRIAISSAEPGDGKTTIAANLAVSIAQAGKKTLVIDADLRKPGMTALIGLKGKPGLADLLAGSEIVARIAPTVIQRTEQPGLDVLPSGLRRPNPAELLSGTTFVELLAWAESHYDQVLVDCPPVLAVSDAQIVGRLVDGAILVVQPQKNHRRLVARACSNFTATGTNVLGIVANGLSAHSNGYGYGYGYGDGYGYGHDVDARETDAAHDRAETITRSVAA